MPSAEVTRRLSLGLWILSVPACLPMGSAVPGSVAEVSRPEGLQPVASVSKATHGTTPTLAPPVPIVTASVPAPAAGAARPSPPSTPAALPGPDAETRAAATPREALPASRIRPPRILPPESPNTPTERLIEEVPRVKAVGVEPIEIVSATTPSVRASVATSPESPSVQALRALQISRPDDAARALGSLTPDNRAALQGLLPLAMKLGAQPVQEVDPGELASMIDQCQQSLDPLRAKAALQIVKLCFCRPVAAPTRFGVYEAIDPNHAFRPGEVLGYYLELRNFVCAEKTGAYQTHLRSSVAICDASGKAVLNFEADRADPSLSPRCDYCQMGRLTLPEGLAPGTYRLQLQMTDVATGRTAQRALEFRVAARGE